MKFNVSHEDSDMEDNGAYGTHPQLTSTSPSLQSNVCYGMLEMKNDTSGTHSQLTSTFPSLQYNVSYGMSELEDNDAYGCHLKLTVSSPSLQSNAVCEDSEGINQEENDNEGHPELTSSLQSNEAYGDFHL